MTTRSHTSVLAVLVAGVAVLDAVAHWPSSVDRAPLPAIAAFDTAAADRVVLGPTDAAVVLQRDQDSWRIAGGPEADPVLVEELLSGLAGGVVPEARVDDADHDRYGLDGGAELRVQVLDGADALVDLYLGDDAGAGATWMRFPGADGVYRVRVGGRGPFDRSPGAWRDRQVTDVPPDRVIRLQIGAWTLERAGDGWISSPALDLDRATVDRLVASLAGLRALEVAAPERAEAAGGIDVVLHTPDAAPVAMWFGSVGQLGYVGRGTERWRIEAALPELLAGVPESLRDRTLWELGSVSRLEVTGGRHDGVLIAEGAGHRLLVPEGVDVDGRRAAAAAAWVAAPRLVRWVEAETFDTAHRWRVFGDGGSRTLELGPTTAGGVLVRDAARPQAVGIVDSRIVDGIEAIFGG